jgi:eukaryotic-like serine/threonine-protein kinase
MQEGTILCDRFRLERSLGRGGMSDVYLAFDLRRQAYVAAKLLREDLAEDPDFVRRFAREAEALARLDHPNIVRFYSFEQCAAQAFIVMDYVPGSTLSRRLREVAGPLPLNEVTHILRHVGAALHFAHHEGYIHRDVKPGNIMLREDGNVLLSDFGIARATESATATMGPAGTPAYMSPEQILGQELTPSADVYSLGVVLFEMATGQRPFSGDVGTGTSRIERVRDAHLHTDPPDPQQINPQLPRPAAAVILHALAKSVDRRFQSVASLVQAWEEALGLPHELPAGGRLISGAAVMARPRTERPYTPQPVPIAASESTPPPPARRSSRRGLGVALAAMLILGMAAVVFFTMFRPGSSGPASQVALNSNTITPSAVPATETPLPPTADTGATSTAMFVAAKSDAYQQVTQEAKETSAVATAAADLVAKEKTETATAQVPTATATATETATATNPPATWTATATVTATKAATARPKPTAVIPNQDPNSIFDFERNYTWKHGDQPYGQLTRSSEQVKAGNSSGRLQYNIPAEAGEKNSFVVLMPQPALRIPGEATGITAWVYGDGTGNYLNAWVKDDAGKMRAYTFGKIEHRGWDKMTAWLDDTRDWPNAPMGGIPAGIPIKYPAWLYALVLDGVREGQANDGVIFLDDLVSFQGSIPAAQPTQPAYVPPASNAAPAPAAPSGARFQLTDRGACAPNAGTSYYDGVVLHRDGSPYNGVCVHTAFNGPRNTKCTGCGIGAGKWSFSPFGGAAPSGISVQVYVVNCPSRGLGDGGINDNFGDLAPLSDVWTHTFNQSEQCTGITFIGD